MEHNLYPFRARYADLADIPVIQYLAYRIWPNAYGKIISPEQLSYMLDIFYGLDSLRDQMRNQGHQFLILEEPGKDIGFASYSAIGQNVYKLHKIYVLPDLQGKGAGKFLLYQVIDNIKIQKAKNLLLNVNRQNVAKHFYEKMGFKVIREEDIDIGRGYFMSDYVMKLELEA
jgi:N-acetylglutamate synthase-like GNAT family acetyltransferase